MSVVLSDGAHAREASQFARLLIAINFGGGGISLRELTVAPFFASIDLGVVWTVHRLHDEEMIFARLNFEKFVFEFIPMSACFVQIFFGDVRNVYAVIAFSATQIPNKSVQ